MGREAGMGYDVARLSVGRNSEPPPQMVVTLDSQASPDANACCPGWTDKWTG